MQQLMFKTDKPDKEMINENVLQDVHGERARRLDNMYAAGPGSRLKGW